MIRWKSITELEWLDIRELLKSRYDIVSDCELQDGSTFVYDKTESKRWFLYRTFPPHGVGTPRFYVNLDVLPAFSVARS
jgi:hypothetical protein